jgi:hypothetical protein
VIHDCCDAAIAFIYCERGEWRLCVEEVNLDINFCPFCGERLEVTDG